MFFRIERLAPALDERKEGWCFPGFRHLPRCRRAARGALGIVGRGLRFYLLNTRLQPSHCALVRVCRASARVGLVLRPHVGGVFGGRLPGQDRLADHRLLRGHRLAGGGLRIEVSARRRGGAVRGSARVRVEAHTPSRGDGGESNRQAGEPKARLSGVAWFRTTMLAHGVVLSLRDNPSSNTAAAAGSPLPRFESFGQRSTTSRRAAGRRGRPVHASVRRLPRRGARVLCRSRLRKGSAKPHTHRAELGA